MVGSLLTHKPLGIHRHLCFSGRQSSAVRCSTSCGDPATGGSSTVFVNGKGVHRQGDATGGHGSWIPNASASGSSNVFAG